MWIFIEIWEDKIMWSVCSDVHNCTLPYIYNIYFMLLFTSEF